MFFQTVDKTLRGQTKSIAVCLVFLPDGRISLQVNPDPEGEAAKSNPALGTGIGLIGTPEELDGGFAGAIGQHAGARLSLIEQVKQQTGAMTAAASAKAAPASVKTKPAAEPLVTASDLSGQIASGATGIDDLFDADEQGA